MKLPPLIIGLISLAIALFLLSSGIQAITLSQSQLAPGSPVKPVVTDAAPAMLPPPDTFTFIQPGYSYKLNWSVAGNIYARYGASLTLTVINEGNNELYIGGIRLEWDTGLSSNCTVSSYVLPRSSGVVGSLFFSAPEAGKHFYGISLSVMAEGPYNTWFDYGWHEGGIQVKTDVVPPPSPANYEKKDDPFPYYNMVNSRITDVPADFHSTVEKIVSDAGLSGPYSVQQVAAVFDWVKTNIPYQEDPDGKDIWYSPNETLQREGGDCEDQAMLVSAMVKELGGTARVYFTDDHAFPVVFIGNENNRGAAERAVKQYYRSDVQVSFMSDEKGYWIVADTASAFYLGTLPVGAAPVKNTSSGWEWDFPNTTILYSVDCTGLTFIEPLTGFFYALSSVGLFIFSSLFLWSAFHREEEKEICSVCGKPIVSGEPVVICQNCQGRFHSVCIMPGHSCPSCGAPPEYMVPDIPPPPSDA